MIFFILIECQPKDFWQFTEYFYVIDTGQRFY